MHYNQRKAEQSEMRWQMQGRAPRTGGSRVSTRAYDPTTLRGAMSLPPIDTHEFCRRADTARGTEPLSGFARVVSLLADPHGEVTWHLTGRSAVRADGSRLAFLELDLQSTVTMRCARCLEPVALPLSEQRSYRLVGNENQAAQEDADDDDYDVLVASRRFDLAALIEDEMIMALPAVPRHEQCQAPAAANSGASTVDRGTQALAPENPFAVLSGFKRPRD